MNLESKIEALLFFKGEPISVKEMVSIFEVTSDEVSQALNNLKNSLENRGVCLISTDEKVMLGTNSQMSDFFCDFFVNSLRKSVWTANNKN